MYYLEIQAPFFLYASSDNHNPTEVVADILAAGLDMPDRDYYLKSDDRFKDARDKYRVHVANIFKLAGYSDADAKTASDTVLQFDASLPRIRSTTLLYETHRQPTIRPRC